MEATTTFFGGALLGGAIGFFIGGWLKQVDLWREGEKQRREDARRTKQTLQEIGQRERRIELILAHYVHDRVLALLESPHYHSTTLDQCLQLASSLDAGFSKVNFPWVPSARQLLASWSKKDTWGKVQTLSISQLQEISEASEAFVDACEYITYDEAAEFTAFMNLGTSETLEQISKRLNAEGHLKVSNILIKELRSYQSDYLEDDPE